MNFRRDIQSMTGVKVFNSCKDEEKLISFSCISDLYFSFFQCRREMLSDPYNLSKTSFLAPTLGIGHFQCGEFLPAFTLYNSF